MSDGRPAQATGPARPTVRVRGWRGAAAVTLAAGDLEATFIPELGLLGASLRHRGTEFLALPGGLAGYRNGHATGLPLLAPWANRLAGRRYQAAGVQVDLEGVELHTDEHGLPIHGTLAAHPGWEVVSLTARDGPARLLARFDYGAWPDLLAAFPFPHELAVEASVDGAALTVATTLRPTGDRPVPVAFGWHPYLRLDGTPRRAWRLELPDREHLLLDDRGIPTGRSEAEPAEADPVGRRTFDDLYAVGTGAELAISGGGRRVAVRYQDGYPFAQVFVPPGKGFACLEPMTAPTNALATGACPLVEPGEELTARFAITVGDAAAPATSGTPAADRTAGLPNRPAARRSRAR